MRSPRLGTGLCSLPPDGPKRNSDWLQRQRVRIKKSRTKNFREARDVREIRDKEISREIQRYLEKSAGTSRLYGIYRSIGCFDTSLETIYRYISLRRL
jgi:hypothetical protein